MEADEGLLDDIEADESAEESTHESLSRPHRPWWGEHLRHPSSGKHQSVLCIYDPAGANGDVFNLMKDYRTAAAGWGVDFTLKPYTDEKTAAEDFKAGQCTAALITGTRARPFQKFSSSIEAMGAPDLWEPQERRVIPLEQEGVAPDEARGTRWPASGPPVRCTSLCETGPSTPPKACRTAARDPRLRQGRQDHGCQIGASLVAADVGTFGGMFNNGSVSTPTRQRRPTKRLSSTRGSAAKAGSSATRSRR